MLGTYPLTLSYCLVIALAVTFRLKRSQLPCVIMYIVLLQIVVHILVHIVMTVGNQLIS